MAKVLLVEDDTTMAEMTRDILESGGFRVAVAYDGVQALKFMGVEPADEIKLKSGETDWKFLANEWTSDPSAIVLPDLILADCMMPRMDGFTLVTELGSNDTTRGIPVIVLTTKEKMEEPFRQLANVVGFIAKPADPDQLNQMVQDALPKA